MNKHSKKQAKKSPKLLVNTKRAVCRDPLTHRLLHIPASKCKSTK